MQDDQPGGLVSIGAFLSELALTFILVNYVPFQFRSMQTSEEPEEDVIAKPVPEFE